MANNTKGHSIQGRLPKRHLYVVPSRLVGRERWVPPGRTLHLLDIENLMGGPHQGADALEEAIRSYFEAVGHGPEDHVVVACNPALVVTVGRQRQGGRILIGHGPDGADRALLSQLRCLDWIASRYDRVIVGSGDGIFTEIVRELVGIGVPVGVISRPQALAHVLARAATFVMVLPGPSVEGEAA